jgi:hypothetical protein
MNSQRARFGAMTLAALVVLALPAVMTPASAQTPSFQVTGQDAAGVEIRFHGIPLRAVHADDAQNALSLDFQTPVDGAVFDRLPGAVPQWVTMAYANFDNGIIRSPRPVTFLTRGEPDGFSLRIVARGDAPPPATAQNAPPPMRGQYDTYGPPGPMPYGAPPPMPAYAGVPNPAYTAKPALGPRGPLREYAAIQLASHRGDPIWELVDGRASLLSDSGVGVRTAFNAYHGGDLMVTTHLSGRYTIAPGIAFVGDVRHDALNGNNVRSPAGAIVAKTDTDLVTGIGGFAFELGRDAELKLEASEGNNVTGGRVSFYSGGPTSFIAFVGDYHTPYLDTLTAAWNRADRDSATLAGGTQLGWGVWASGAGHFTNYGVHGDSQIAYTAGWDGSLRWTTPLPWFGVQAGLAYDGFGEYRLDYDTRAGAAPTPYVPLGIRNIENHAVKATLTTGFAEGLWLNAYAGWVADRYSSDGLLAGLDLHYTPMAGVDFALGVRQSQVSYTQGESGPQTSAGFNLTLGFGAPPQPSWMLNAL